MRDHAEVQARVRKPNDANGWLCHPGRLSARTANTIADQLLTKLSIREQIAKRDEAYLAKLDVSAARIRARLVTIGFGDVGNLFDAQGVLKPMTELTPEHRALIAGIDIIESPERGRIVKVRLRDQIRAIELLARHSDKA
jgi:phage terminase small subunit